MSKVKIKNDKRRMRVSSSPLPDAVAAMNHGELVKAGLRDEDDMSGLIPESHNCIDCGYNTHPGSPNRAKAEQLIAAQKAAGIKKWSIDFRWNNQTEAYFVHDHVWKAAGMRGEWGDGALCIGCLEKRIGRELKPDDFLSDHPFNNPTLPGTRRRFERLTGSIRWEGLGEYPPPQASKLDLALNAALSVKRWRCLPDG
jgi:hypothetical protein